MILNGKMKSDWLHESNQCGLARRWQGIKSESCYLPVVLPTIFFSGSVFWYLELTCINRARPICVRPVASPTMALRGSVAPCVILSTLLRSLILSPKWWLLLWWWLLLLTRLFAWRKLLLEDFCKFGSGDDGGVSVGSVDLSSIVNSIAFCRWRWWWWWWDSMFLSLLLLLLLLLWWW